MEGAERDEANTVLFSDRVDAGRRLAGAVRHLREERPVVLGLPRGGLPVAFEVARALGAPLDVIVVRKLGVPYQPELGFGAIGEGGVRVISEEIVRHCGIRPAERAAVERREEQELLRRARRYRDGRPRTAVEGRTVIVVDDGIATGATAAAACRVARAQGAARVVLAVPTAPADTVGRLREVADEVVCLAAPDLFGSVGQWYRDFSQTTDEEVIAYLAQAARSGPVEAEVEVDAGGIGLVGDLALPEGARAVVMFAHGSGSSRHSPRNRSVASALRAAGLGTLLFDLLTPAEEGDRANVFDIDTLAARLSGATRWLRQRESLAIGYFGASTGAAAALRAAADDAADDTAVGAVVSRGGRPDLAAPRLGDVRAPTLLIVGGHDPMVVDLNRAAQAELRCENRLDIVPGATHLFEEPGALDQVADLARDWFIGHLTAKDGRPGAGGPGVPEQPHGHRELPGALRAQSPIGHLDIGHPEAEPFGGRQRRQRVAFGVHVPDGSAAGADQVLVRMVRVRVVTLGASVGGHLDHLAERDELTEGVVDGGTGDLRQPGGGAREHLVRGEMDVFAVEHLGDHPALSGHPPATSAEPFEQVAHVHQPNFASLNIVRRMNPYGALSVVLTWTWSIVGSDPADSQGTGQQQGKARDFSRRVRSTRHPVHRSPTIGTASRRESSAWSRSRTRSCWRSLPPSTPSASSVCAPVPGR